MDPAGSWVTLGTHVAAVRCVRAGDKIRLFIFYVARLGVELRIRKRCQQAAPSASARRNPPGGE
jgi:hypothetical protein|tara:strand:+ start:110 stop:301 length:192 start_codon:yes stop_codon:yes gene_type:complete